MNEDDTFKALRKPDFDNLCAMPDFHVNKDYLESYGWTLGEFINHLTNDIARTVHHQGKPTTEEIRLLGRGLMHQVAQELNERGRTDPPTEEGHF